MFFWNEDFFSFHLFLLVGGLLLYNIVVVFAIHWRESAMDLHLFPILIPPPASFPIPPLWVEMRIYVVYSMGLNAEK